ncbi:hypothetical protein WDU94_004268 [Cyamophila willieti]
MAKPGSSEEKISYCTLDSDDSCEFNVVRKAICCVDELPLNTLQEFMFENRKILVVRQREGIYAVGDKCTHRGDPLVNGVLGRGRVRCSTCGSCFSLSTGLVEDSPTLDPLPCYQVEVLDNTVYVSIKHRDLQEDGCYRLVLPPRIEFETKETFVIIGGGPAAATCIEHLRDLAYAGRIFVFMREPRLPYYRSALSKVLVLKKQQIQLRSPEVYRQLGVNVYLSTTVDHLNINAQTIVSIDGPSLSYDKLFIATGCEARRLPSSIPGITGAKGVFYLRYYSDASEIRRALNKDVDLIIVGTGFLGMEIAATILPHVKSIKIISMTAYPFENIFGPVVGRRLLKLFIDKGIVMTMSDEIVSVITDPETSTLTGMVLKSGEIIYGNVAIICVGITYNTQLLDNTGVEMTPDGAVVTDEYLATNIPNVYVGGDIACSPLHPYFNTTTTSTVYSTAMKHGKIAAASMLGKRQPVDTIPFIKVYLGESTLQCVGHIKHVEQMQVVGNLDEMKFAAYYMDGDRVTALLTSGLNTLGAKFAETVHMGKHVTRYSIRDHVWSSLMFTCVVHERDEEYKLDFDKLRQTGLVF